jgi:drug/metabolite transporter (DMT)-like permease
MDLLLALAGAILFAVGTVLQQQEAKQADEQQALSAGFLIQLAKRPRWLLGIATDFLGFLCQAAALAVGRLVVVQPVLASSILFALPFGARLTGEPVGRRRWIAAGVTTLGLAVFLLVGDPSGGLADASTATWIAWGGGALVVSGALVLLARGTRPARRAALLGASAGVLFGISAGLTKATVEQLDGGVLAIFSHWHLYALIVVGYLSMTLSEAALQTGQLAPALATQMTIDPIVSVLMGVFAFHETIHGSAWGVVVSVSALMLMLAGIVVLALGEDEGIAAQAAAQAAAPPRPPPTIPIA